MQLTSADLAHLKRLHPDLARVVNRAAKNWKQAGKSFFITCSLRTLAEQKKLVAAGASQTMRSRHLPGKSNGLSHAVDLAIKLDNKLRWDWPLFVALAKDIKAAAAAEKVSLEWGGDWKSFRDGPHFQLPWSKYPG